MHASPQTILAQQASPLDGLHFLLLDSAGRGLGELQWPFYAQATNARLKIHGDDPGPGSVQLRCHQDNYLIQFEYLSRGWQNDTRYTLRAEDAILASASLRFDQGRLRRGVMRLESPLQATLVRHRAWLRHRFDLVGPDGTTLLGRLEEPKLISATRQLRAELPGMSLPQQAFCLFLGLHLIQTQL